MQERKRLQGNAPAKEPIKYKADIAKPDKQALSAKQQKRLNSNFLVAASKGKNSDILRLIKVGANITTKNNHDMTALHLAAANRNTQTCALIIKKYAKAGGDVKKLIAAKDNDGWTVIYNAAAEGCTQLCILLIEKYAKAGGDVMKLLVIKNNEGETAFDFVVSHFSGQAETAHFLKSIEKLGADMGKETFSSFIISFGDCIAA
jgi:ankyrin repeat protein